MCQVISLKFPRYIVDLLIYIFRHYFIFGKFCQIRILIILIHWFILFQGLIIYVLDFFAYQVYQSFFLWSFFNVFLLSHFQYFLPSVFLFVNYILLIMLLQLFQFFPLWSPPPSTLHSLRQSPHHCSCPWVMCISSLVIPFPILSFTSPWLFCTYQFVLPFLKNCRHYYRCPPFVPFSPSTQTHPGTEELLEGRGHTIHFSCLSTSCSISCSTINTKAWQAI